MNKAVRTTAAALGALCATGAILLAAATATAASGSSGDRAQPTSAGSSDGVVTDTTGGDTGGLIVSPRTALFDVRLYAGESEQRRATLTNASSEPVLVHLSSTVTDHWGPTGSTDQIMFAASTGDCPTTHDVALTSGQSIEHGRLEPGETRDICISVALLPDATDAPAGIATADLQFESIAIGEHLAETGTGIPALALGIAGATLLAGAMLAGTRKKTDNA